MFAPANAIICYQCTECSEVPDKETLADCGEMFTACYVTEGKPLIILLKKLIDPNS